MPLTGPALARFRKKLLRWFGQFQRDLPWRSTSDPYRIWLSEIMLQQTRVAAAIPYYERFLQRFPDVKTLAEAPQEDVLRLWAGLGYYSRARNLQAAAKEILGPHSGKFPDDESAALALPGIGKYTAAAILSIAYGKKLAVLDGNVARVLARLGAIHADLRAEGRWQQLQKTADSLLDPRRPGDWNQSMMELGATVCTPRSPQCLLCPVSDHCQARKLGLAEIIPEKRKKRDTVELTLAAVVFLDKAGRTLLLPPPKGPSGNTDVQVEKLLSRMWRVPTIQVEKNPVAELQWFLKRTFAPGKELSIELEPLAKVRHAVTYRNITLLPFRARVAKLPHLPGARKLALDQVASVPISNLTRKAVRAAKNKR
jgi:A/G-specific adenine glycosylase